MPNSSTIEHPTSTPWDLPAVMEKFLNKAPIILQFMEAFETRVSVNFQKILIGLETCDAHKVTEGINAIKGSAGILSSVSLLELSCALEQFARTGDMESVKEAMPELEAEIKRCRDFIPEARKIISNNT